MGRADLWREWRTPTGTRPEVFLPEVVCPNDFDKRDVPGALSFVVNCGISDEAGDVPDYEAISGADTYNQSAWGLFFDHDNSNGLPGTQEVQIGLDEIQDGVTQTLLLSENQNADNWATPTGQPDVGFVWWTIEGTPAPPWVGVVPDEVMINSLNWSTPRYAARPSSSHPGGVNAVFADGHAEFISDQIDYDVFRDQMISDQTEARNAGLISP